VIGLATIVNPVAAKSITTAIAATLRKARASRGLTSAELAERSGVSRAMIGKIERGDAQPTAALLARIAAALDMTLSDLIAHAEGDDRRLVRTAEQPTWVDPATGYQRRAVSPAGGRPLQLIEVMLPAGARVALPAEAYAFIHQQIWVLQGRLAFHEGDVEHLLDTGDCLQLGPPAACVFENPTRKPSRYLVALTRRYE
jgi:transcriptional regulator with XRE-family HTH domain